LQLQQYRHSENHVMQQYIIVVLLTNPSGDALALSLSAFACFV